MTNKTKKQETKVVTAEKASTNKPKNIQDNVTKQPALTIVPDQNAVDKFPNKAPVEDFVFAEESDLKNYIKGTDFSELVSWAKSLNLEWKDAGEGLESVTRMRLAMAIKAHYFPRDIGDSQSATDSEPKSPKYEGYSDKDLIKLLKQHKIEHKSITNASINRMQMIMKLKKAGVISESAADAKTEE